MTDDKILDEWRGIWFYEAIFTQSSTGAFKIDFDFEPGDRAKFLSMHIGPDDYGAGRTLTMFLIERSTALLMMDLLPPGGTSIDNVVVNWPTKSADFGTGNFAAVQQGMILPGNSRLRVQVATPINNETLTLVATFLVSSRKGIVSPDNSGGIVAGSSITNIILNG